MNTYVQIAVLVCRLFTEILNAVHDCNDIKFSENGSWAPIVSKSSSSSKLTVADDSSLLVHTVTGLHSMFLVLRQTPDCL